LERVASKFWPREISEQEAELSIVPKLLESQDAFLSILGVPVPGIERVFDLIDASTLPANLFLKHLVVLADFGGEMLQRVNAQFASLFPDSALEYIWLTESGAETRLYRFRQMPVSNLSNDRLGLSGRRLLEKQPRSPLHEDIIALLILGKAATNENVSNVLAKCEISDCLGKPQSLEKFVRQRYIWVSRITAGSQSNNLGQIAQRFVMNYLRENINFEGIGITANGHIPRVRHTEDLDKRETTFDITVSNGEKYVAVEVSFQVTTNSVIERKSGQAQARYEQIAAKGYRIAYVLDGAGNFQRESALRTICAYSHCTVAFSASELVVLCQFIRDYFRSEPETNG
jgi:hypothetical protein